MRQSSFDFYTFIYYMVLFGNNIIWFVRFVMYFYHEIVTVFSHYELDYCTCGIRCMRIDDATKQTRQYL